MKKKWTCHRVISAVARDRRYAQPMEYELKAILQYLNGKRLSAEWDQLSAWQQVYINVCIKEEKRGDLNNDDRLG